MSPVGLLLLLAYASAQQTVQFVHLAYTGNVTEMVVGWYTQASTTSSTVQFGPAADQLYESAYGGANYWKEGYGYNHFVLLAELKPNTKYWYRCGDPSGGWSNVTSFETPPLKEHGAFTIGIWGDMGITNSQNTMARVIERAQNNEFDWIFHVGDISYADDHVFSFQSTWNTFFESMQPLMSKLPYMVCPGNHEWASRDPFLYLETRNFVVYNHRFLMPSANSQSQSMYYSFNYANVHFISMSTETSYPNAPFGSKGDFGDEVAWLIADLEEANLPENRKQQPWIIVMGHRPIYSSAVGYSVNGVPINSHVHPSNSLTLQQTFENIFYKYHVDIAFNGHVHSYERNYPTYQNRKTSSYNKPQSTFNVVIGNAGNIEGKENGNEENWTTPQPEWSGFRYGDDYGYGMLTVFNDTDLQWQFFSATDNVLRDSVHVTK